MPVLLILCQACTPLPSTSDLLSLPPLLPSLRLKNNNVLLLYLSVLPKICFLCRQTFTISVEYKVYICRLAVCYSCRVRLGSQFL